MSLISDHRPLVFQLPLQSNTRPSLSGTTAFDNLDLLFV